MDAPADVFTRLAEANVNVDMIVQSQSRTGTCLAMASSTERVWSTLAPNEAISSISS